MSNSAKHPTRNELFDFADPDSTQSISDTESRRIKMHLDVCKKCQEYVDGCKVAVEVGQQFRAGTLPPLSPEEQAEAEAMDEQILSRLRARFIEDYIFES